MTLRAFVTMLDEMGNVLKMELGTSDEKEGTSLTGEQGFNLAKRIFPRGR